MRAIKTIAAREFQETLRGKSYRLTTLLGLIGLIALSFLPTFINWIDRKNVTPVIVADKVGGLLTALNASLDALPSDDNRKIRFVAPPTDTPLEKDALDDGVNSGRIKAYLLVSPPQNGASEPVFELAAKRPSANLIRSVEQAVRPIALGKRLTDLKLTQQQAMRLQAPVLAEVKNVDNRYTDTKEMIASQSLVYLLLFLLYLTLVGYGSVLTNGVAAEKGSRIMEMMLVSVRPTDLLAGKIVGLGLASLLQYALWVVAGLSVSLARGALDNLMLSGVPLQISAIAPSTILYFILYYTLGYFAYSALFAAAGCLVNRPEESSQTVMPVVLLMVAAYMIAVISFSNPDGALPRIASLIPFLTPMVMFTRIVTSNVPALEVLVSVVFTLLFIWVSIRIGARIYRYSVLRTRKASWLEGLRGAKPTSR